MNGTTAVLPGKIAVRQATSKTKKTSKIKKRTWLKLGVGFIVMAILLGSGFGYVEAYDEKIYPKLVVAGVKVGGMTFEQANEAVNQKAKELNENGPEITFNNQTLKQKLDEMGVTFNVDEAVQTAFQYGRSGNFLGKIKENWQVLIHHHQIEITPQIDEEKFNAYLGQLAKVAEKEPVNAALTIKNGQIILSSAEKGRGLDKEKLKKELKNFINSGQNGQIVMETSDLEPAITEDGTTSARTQAEKLMSATPITV